MPTTSAASAQGHHRHMIAVIVLVPALVALALWAFAWPAARTAPATCRSAWRARPPR